MTAPSLSLTPGQAAAAHGMNPPQEDPPPARESSPNGLGPHHEAPLLKAPLLKAPYDTHLAIEVADWDVLFDAVKTTLRQVVGERLADLPEVPAHSAALSASLVQAVVLDCVGSLDRLHAALKQERSQRPPP